MHSQAMLNKINKQQEYRRRRIAEKQACEGIPTEHLEAGVVKEMVGALEDALACVEDYRVEQQIERLLTKLRGEG